MASKLLMLCLFSSILIYNLQYQTGGTETKSDSAPDLTLGVTNRRKRDLTHTGPKSDPAPAPKKLDLKSKQKENREKLLKAYAKFETQVNDQITSMIKNLHQEGECEHGKNEDGTCKKKPEADSQVLKENDPIVDPLLERLEYIHEVLLGLIPLATYSTETTANSAHVSHPIMRPNLTDSVNISCDSEGKHLRFCWWERHYKGQREVIHIQGDVIENEGKAGVDNVLYNGDGLARGDCSVEMQKFGMDDIGHWKCSLFTQVGETLTGFVTVVTSRQTKWRNYFTTSPYQLVTGRMNGSANLMCDSGGQALAVCWWDISVNGRPEIVMVDQEVSHDGGRTFREGIISFGSELRSGKCGVRVKNLKPNDFVKWWCTMIMQNGSISRAEIGLQNENGKGIYFGSASKGFKYFSLTSSEVSIIPISSTALGVAFDWNGNKIYGCYRYEIFRCNRNGTELETVLDTDEYGKFATLAFDWITGNVYVTSSNGSILACNGRQNSPYTCATVVGQDGSGPVKGLALHPMEGNMYWTKWGSRNSSSVIVGGMDGEKPTPLATRLRNPRGIAIDILFRRLYWTDRDRIESSDLSGRDTRVVEQLADGSRPFGIAVLQDRIYWSTWGTFEFQSQAKSGGEIRTHFTRKGNIGHLAVGPNAGLPTNRTNHCAGHKCRKVCVLTADSFKCKE